MVFKQLTLTRKRTSILPKICGGILIVFGCFLFLTGVLAILTIIGIFYTLGAGLIAVGLIYGGLTLIFGKVKTECPYCKAKLTLLLISKHSIKCHTCRNLILLKLKD